MKFMKSLAMLAMAVTVSHAGDVRWVLGGFSGVPENCWAFLVQANNTTPANYESGQWHISGEAAPIFQWDSVNNGMIFNGGAGEIVAVAMMNTYDFNGPYGIQYVVNGRTYDFGDRPSMNLGSTDAGLAVYNDREFFFSPTTALGDSWDPNAGDFYMILFNPNNLTFAAAGTLQKPDVSLNDVTKLLSPDGEIDPFFPRGYKGSTGESGSGIEGGEGGYGDWEGWGWWNGWGGWDDLQWAPLTMSSTGNNLTSDQLPDGFKFAANDAIPEPATATLVVLGCALIGLRRRMRRG